jgi:hypothetical protein
MAVGAYTLVDERLREIPPGLIDHREWTDANGRNNALRIDGLGAPRAFATEALRRVGFPNVGYGEDYGRARLSRSMVGRIYEPLSLPPVGGEYDAAARGTDEFMTTTRTGSDAGNGARRKMNGAWMEVLIRPWRKGDFRRCGRPWESWIAAYRAFIPEEDLRTYFGQPPDRLRAPA